MTSSHLYEALKCPALQSSLHSSIFLEDRWESQRQFKTRFSINVKTGRGKSNSSHFSNFPVLMAPGQTQIMFGRTYVPGELPIFGTTACCSLLTPFPLNGL